MVCFVFFCFFFYWFVFLFWGGILNKFIAVRYLSLVLDISFYSGKLGPKGCGGADREAQGGKGSLSPRLVADKGLCLELVGSEGPAAGSFWKWGRGDGACLDETSSRNHRRSSPWI